MDKDGVHLNSQACRCAAVSLCNRYLRESETWMNEKVVTKRRRMTQWRKSNKGGDVKMEIDKYM